MGNFINKKNQIENIENNEKKHLVIMLRGHIRQSFKSDTLYLFIKELMKTYNLHIYIHTWDIFQNTISWRRLAQDNNIVTKNIIYGYFRDCNQCIKNIIIDNDKNLNLIGNLFGTICNTKMPVIGWKNMWYGINSNISKVINDVPSSIPIVNMRFDLFDVFVNNKNHINQKNALDFINKNYSNYYNKNIFYYEKENLGIDNIIIGNTITLYKLIQHFYLNLDNILLKYPNNKHQEFLVFRENNII